MTSYQVCTNYGTSYVEAKSRSQARYRAWHASGASESIDYMPFTKYVKSICKCAEMPGDPGEVEARKWNAANPVGTRVRYWTGLREGPGAESRTRSKAKALSPDHASVWIEGQASCIALSHVEVLP